MKASRKNYGALQVIEVCSQNYSPKDPTIFLFHGYGADASDLAPLSQVVEFPFESRWIFPEGILEVHLGGGFYGRSWFPIDVNALEESLRTGVARDLSNLNPPGLEALTGQVLEAIHEACPKDTPIVIGGFSQGAMLSVEVAQHLGSSLKALVLLSGALMRQSEWAKGLQAISGTPFFQSHGRSDSVLSFEGAKNLEKILLASGLKGQLMPFPGGHEIPQDVLMALQKFLTKRISPAL